MARTSTREPINLFGIGRTTTDGGSGGTSGDSTRDSVGNDTTGLATAEGSQEPDTTPASFISLDEPIIGEQQVIIEAPELPKRRGRRARLSTSEGSSESKPLQSPSKRAEKYIKKLQMLWYKMHGLVGAVIDDHLRWTIEESQLFAEAAYDVFAERGWLKYLDKANEAYLLVIVVEIEISKVKAMLADQKANPKNAKVGPPPQLKAVQSNPPSNPGNGVPSFIPADKSLIEGL